MLSLVFMTTLMLNQCGIQSVDAANSDSDSQHKSRSRRRQNHRIQFQLPSPLVKVSYSNDKDSDSSSSSLSSLYHRYLQPTETLEQTDPIVAEESPYRPLRIKFDTQPLIETLKQSQFSDDPQDIITQARGNAIINTVLPQIESLWSQALSIIPSKQDLVIPADVCFELYNFPPEWSDSNRGIKDTDLLMFISAFDTIGDTELCNSKDEALSTLAVSSPCAIDPHSDRPVVGFANVCLNTITTNEDGAVDPASVQTMIDVLSHELVHVLGLNSELYKYFRNSKNGKSLTKRKKTFLGKDAGFEISEAQCVNGQSTRMMEVPCENTVQYKTESIVYNNGMVERGYYEVLLPTVATVAQNHFNCPTLSGVRLENQPTSEDCFGSHFDERTWFTEFMSAVYDEDAAVLSPLTLAFLEDTGWYKSDFTQASNSPFGLKAGCDFVNESCIVDEKVPAYGKGFFCDDLSGEEWMCGPSHEFRAKCDLESYAYPRRTYFEPNHLGPSFTHADFCPMAVSKAVDCDDDSGDVVKIHPQIEVFGSGSQCIDVTIKGNGKGKGNGNVSNVKQKMSSACLKTGCNSDLRTFDFEVENKIYSCDSDYQIIHANVSSIEYEFTCPRITQVCPNMFCPSMCSGKGVCDWDAAIPMCKCFDKNDTTEGCYESNLNEAKACNPSSAFRLGGHYGYHGTVLVVVSMLTAWLWVW